MAPERLDSVQMIKRLVAFDTTSRNSNLELIDFIRAYLADLGVESVLVHDDPGTKANLFATIGPADRPGICLSGHTDVVPVDGQDWSSDPFEAVVRDGRLYGRGTVDMKGFVGVVLALVPEFVARPLATPLHLAFSYDEEVGCLGVRRMLEDMRGWAVRPIGCIVGEPSRMRVVVAHKGNRRTRCRVKGRACHSSLAPQGVNAIEVAAEIVSHLRSMARTFIAEGPFDPAFDVPFTTLNTGRIRGGTAMNIVAEECWFEFEFRFLPSVDDEALVARVRAFAEETLLPEMRAVSADANIGFERVPACESLDTPEDAEIVALATALTGNNATDKVAFGTEAGLFQRAGIPSVVCGPGHIDQAHTTDEFVELDQIARCEAFLRRLLERLARGPFRPPPAPATGR